MQRKSMESVGGPSVARAKKELGGIDSDSDDSKSNAPFESPTALKRDDEKKKGNKKGDNTNTPPGKEGLEESLINFMKSKSGSNAQVAKTAIRVGKLEHEVKEVKDSVNKNMGVLSSKMDKVLEALHARGR